MTSTVQKWGNSLALRIPSTLAKDVQLHQGCVVELTVDAGRIVLKPVRRGKASLSRMLKAVTKDNLHPEQDWGAPAGGELM